MTYPPPQDWNPQLPPGNYPVPGSQPPPAYPPPGYPAPGGYPPPGYPPRAGTNGMAIGSLVCSVAGLACYGIPSIVGIVLGVVAMNQIKQTGQEGRGMALAGVIVGGVAVVLWIIGIILYVIFIVYALNSSSYSSSY